MKRRTATDARRIARPRQEAVHPLVRDPNSLAALKHEMAEARSRREPWDVDGTFEVGQAPAVGFGFNPGGAWGGIS